MQRNARRLAGLAAALLLAGPSGAFEVTESVRVSAPLVTGAVVSVPAVRPLRLGDRFSFPRLPDSAPLRAAVSPAAPATPLSKEIRVVLPYAPASAAEVLPAVTGLEDLYRSIERSTGRDAVSELYRKYFDQAGKNDSGRGGFRLPADASSPLASPKYPKGVKLVSVDVVRTEADVDRFIPVGMNSKALIERLKLAIKDMAPYRIYTYYDGVGGTFTGIDLSSKPRLIDILPEQHSHEVRLIKKIQLWNKDLQVLVREDGKTPDLVIGGVVTELKSLMGREIDFPFLVNKANLQVLRHARRHGLGHGAAIVDLTEERQVPVGRVLADLNAWRLRTRTVVLDKVFVFAGMELKLFTRQLDGSYRAEEPNAIPFAPALFARKVDPKDIAEVEGMIAQGRLEAAHVRLHSLERFVPAPELEAALLEVRELLETQRFLGRLKDFLAAKLLPQAERAWQNYQKVHSAENIGRIKNEVEALIRRQSLT